MKHNQDDSPLYLFDGSFDHDLTSKSLLDDEAINYFVDLLPRIKRTHRHVSPIEFTQEPGETVFVPGGWWHGVLNVEDSVAVTQVLNIQSLYHLLDSGCNPCFRLCGCDLELLLIYKLRQSVACYS